MPHAEVTHARQKYVPLICVMGVSAAGKSTVGIALAETLGVPFVDADSLHSDANRTKMNAGTPLTDDDRWPWLDTVGGRFEDSAYTGLVMACSALRRVYRDRIRAAVPGVVFVHLHGSPELLRERAGARADHFMPASLLDSQLATLEPLDDDEAGFVVNVDRGPDELVREIVERLSAR
ncbi:gluconokinase [Microbacterium sp. CH12i]|uniref:gluconokinase n=1 Tax=Microbacterium sp. CH12i TaxID=1479651 RepID=UPI00190F5EBF|nr:gluconokinase [Microbacterium sp. CH12i]